MSEPSSSKEDETTATTKVGKETEEKEGPCCVFFNKRGQRKNQLRKRVTVGPSLKTAANNDPEEKDSASKEEIGRGDNSSDEGEGNEPSILDVLPLKRNKRTPLSEIQSVSDLFNCLV